MVSKHTARHNKRKKPMTAWLRLLAKVLIFIILLWLVAWAVVVINPAQLLHTTLYWHIDKTLPIQQTILEKKIQHLITGQYWPDLHHIKQTLKTEPWIRTAQIKRLLWNTIQINITAKQVAMRWHNINCKKHITPKCHGYISVNGVLFTPIEMGVSDAALAISKPNQSLISKLYVDYQHYQTLAEPLIVQSFAKTHVDKLVFVSGVTVVLGAKNQTEQLNRFIKAYNKLKKKNSKVKRATFDMRYTKGFTLRYD